MDSTFAFLQQIKQNGYLERNLKSQISKMKGIKKYCVVIFGVLAHIGFCILTLPLLVLISWRVLSLFYNELDKMVNLDGIRNLKKGEVKIYISRSAMVSSLES